MAVATNPRFLVCYEEPLGLVAEVIKAKNCDVVSVDRNADDYTVELFIPSQYCGLILLGGGKLSADEENCFDAEKAWLQTAMISGTAVLGICLGGQLVATACGGTIGHHGYRLKKKTGSRFVDKGLFPLSLSKIGHDDPILRHAQNAVFAQWHEDTFTVPAGAVELAESTQSILPHSEAFRIRHNVYALQFHPEPTSGMLRSLWFPHEYTDKDLQSAAAAGRKLIDAWVDIAIRDWETEVANRPGSAGVPPAS